MEKVKNKYHETFWAEIRQLSCNRDGTPEKILSEWKYSHKMSVDDFSEECLCRHEICTIYFYKNILNGTLIKVGSKCIDYWQMAVPLCNCGKKISRPRLKLDKKNCSYCEKTIEKEEERKKKLEERDKLIAQQQEERRKNLEASRIASEKLLKEWEEVRSEKQKQIELNRLGEFRIFWYGPWRNLLFKEVIGNVEWASILVNVADDIKNESLRRFEKYCRLLDLVQDEE